MLAKGPDQLMLRNTNPSAILPKVPEVKDALDGRYLPKVNRFLRSKVSEKRKVKGPVPLSVGDL